MPRELSDSELETVAITFCGMQPGDFERATDQLEMSMDDDGEIDFYPWPQSAKIAFLLAAWTPAGKAS